MINDELLTMIPISHCSGVSLPIQVLCLTLTLWSLLCVYTLTRIPCVMVLILSLVSWISMFTFGFDLFLAIWNMIVDYS